MELNNQFNLSCKKYIVIHPLKTQSWGEVSITIKEWINFINLLILYTNFKIVIVGNKNEIMKNNLIYTAINKNINFLNLTGKTSFNELVSVVKNALCVISSDTGVMHQIHAMLKHLLDLRFR